MSHAAKLAEFTKRAYAFPETVRETYDLTAGCGSLPGDLVECGIAMGSQLAAMKLAAPHRLAWGFDSFEGIQLAGKDDDVQPGIGFLTADYVPPADTLVSSGVTAHAKRHVEAALVEWGFKLDGFRLVEGWVQHTLVDPANLPETIAVLRLDMDMHDPTLCALEVLWPRLVANGVLIIDDWGYLGVQKATQTYFARIGYEPEWHKPHYAAWLRK